MDWIPHRGAHWHIELPQHWQRLHEHAGVVYFESTESEVGIYLAVWDTQRHNVTAAVLVQEFALLERGEGDVAVMDKSWCHQQHDLKAGDVVVESWNEL